MGGGEQPRPLHKQPLDGWRVQALCPQRRNVGCQVALDFLLGKLCARDGFPERLLLLRALRISLMPRSEKPHCCCRKRHSSGSPAASGPPGSAAAAAAMEPRQLRHRSSGKQLAASEACQLLLLPLPLLLSAGCSLLWLLLLPLPLLPSAGCSLLGARQVARGCAPLADRVADGCLDRRSDCWSGRGCAAACPGPHPTLLCWGLHTRDAWPLRRLHAGTCQRAFDCCSTPPAARPSAAAAAAGDGAACVTSCCKRPVGHISSFGLFSL